MMTTLLDALGTEITNYPMMQLTIARGLTGGGRHDGAC